MTPDIQIASPSSELSNTQNRVLRNTYMLLALSMIPTVIGAFAGIQMNFSFMAGSPLIGFVLFRNRLGLHVRY
jgi:FtsH-binding integral membrane protein